MRNYMSNKSRVKQLIKEIRSINERIDRSMGKMKSIEEMKSMDYTLVPIPKFKKVREYSSHPKV